MKLQILGTGCPNCRRLTAATEEAARNLGLDYELEKVEDIDSIVAFGVLRTPALAVDGTVKLSGRVPSVADIERLLG
ncbi:MAG TPA: thioredoxin family protein [Thermoanaerobaculia bacterium]|nr:thioredoxin family protein [Thermoanaerobaculia bacterium]